MIRAILKRLIYRTLNPRITQAMLISVQQEQLATQAGALRDAKAVIALLEGDTTILRQQVKKLTAERDSLREEADGQRAEKERQQRLLAEETAAWNRERLRLEAEIERVRTELREDQDRLRRERNEALDELAAARASAETTAEAYQKGADRQLLACCNRLSDALDMRPVDPQQGGWDDLLAQVRRLKGGEG